MWMVNVDSIGDLKEDSSYAEVTKSTQGLQDERRRQKLDWAEE